MRQFYRARIKLSDELKIGENIQRAESFKKSEQEKENEELSIINSTKISALERGKCRTSSRMSSCITEQILNGEQLTHETINLTLKILKKTSTPSRMALKVLLWDELHNTVTIKRILSKYFTLIITGQLPLVNL